MMGCFVLAVDNRPERSIPTWLDSIGVVLRRGLKDFFYFITAWDRTVP